MTMTAETKQQDKSLGELCCLRANERRVLACVDEQLRQYQKDAEFLFQLIGGENDPPQFIIDQHREQAAGIKKLLQERRESRARLQACENQLTELGYL